MSEGPSCGGHFVFGLAVSVCCATNSSKSKLVYREWRHSTLNSNVFSRKRKRHSFSWKMPYLYPLHYWSSGMSKLCVIMCDYICRIILGLLVQFLCYGAFIKDVFQQVQEAISLLYVYKWPLGSSVKTVSCFLHTVAGLVAWFLRYLISWISCGLSYTFLSQIEIHN